MNNGQVYPWMEGDFNSLCRLEGSGRLPHALLFAGAADIGKKDLALRFANYLLCRTGDSRPCGVCANCLLCRAGTHPDLFQITRQDSKQVKMQQIRGLIHWAMQTANQGGRKVALIDPADAMNVQSSNALLKCLEEPRPGTGIILISSEPMSLLPTIRSRCRTVNFRLPPTDISLDWLQNKVGPDTDAGILLAMAEGRPLRVLSFDEAYLSLRKTIAEKLVAVTRGSASPVSFVAFMAKEEPGTVLELLYHLVADSIAFSLSGEKRDFKNRDLRRQLTAYAAAADVNERSRLLERTVTARRLQREASNANPAMLLEWVLMAKESGDIEFRL